MYFSFASTPIKVIIDGWLEWLGVGGKKKEKTKSYLYLYFNSQFKILRIDSNLSFVKNMRTTSLLPKTLYRYIDLKEHKDLLKLFYILRYQSPDITHTIYLYLLNTRIKALGILKVLVSNKEYCLILNNIEILSKNKNIESYHDIPAYVKQLAYRLYDEIYKLPYLEPISITDFLQTFPNSRTTLYTSFQRVIGTKPSIVWRDRRLITFKQHLLKSNEYINASYWKFGYVNRSVLYNNFKKVFKMSPSDFRKKYRHLK